MRVENTGANTCILCGSDFDLLFSYDTPVALVWKETKTGYKTQLKHSRTTSKHINQFFADYSGEIINRENPIEVEQSRFDNLCE